MSHYNKITVPLMDRECLINALVEIGYARQCIESHDEPVGMYGYHGDLRPEKAHVIIRRVNVGRAANDIGFVIGKDGQAIISDYDRRNHFDDKRLSRLKMLYAKNVIMKANKGKAVEVVEENGQMKVRVRV